MFEIDTNGGVFFDLGGHVDRVEPSNLEPDSPVSSRVTFGFRDDASLEEILHLITQYGYAKVYPNKLGENKNSDIAKAMDKARGGYFKNVPNSYPSSAWYTYDDKTCNYS